MDINVLLQVINTVGFPILVCGAMGWFCLDYINKERAERIQAQKSYQEQLDKMSTQHKEEMEKVTTALNNNTIALTKLCEKMDS